MVDKLKKLMALCKCSVSLEVNKHRDYYETAEQNIKEMYSTRECPPEIADDVKKKMIETDTIIELQFYPRTPIGFYVMWHYDLDMILDDALGCIKKKGGGLK